MVCRGKTVDGIDYVKSLCQLQKEGCEILVFRPVPYHCGENGNSNASDKNEPDFVLASVDYGIAPEAPFPAAVIDCLLALSFFVETCSFSSIHVSGQSAGGNLAAVTTFEGFRKYPGRIKRFVLIKTIHFK